MDNYNVKLKLQKLNGSTLASLNHVNILLNIVSLLSLKKRSWIFIEMFEEPSYVIAEKLVLNEE